LRRENLLKTFAKKGNYYLPFTFDATQDAVNKIKKDLALKSDTDLISYFGCDIFSVPTDVTGSPIVTWPSPGENMTIWGTELVTVTHKSGGQYVEFGTPPLAYAESAKDVENYQHWPNADEIILHKRPATADYSEKIATCVVHEGGFTGPFGIPWQMRGMENLLMDMIAEPEIVDAMIERLDAITLPILKWVLEEYGDIIDMIGCGDDYGTQKGLLISPEHFRRFFGPSLKRHYDLAKSYGKLCYHHSCGAVRELIPDMIDCGLDVLNPIQVRATGMDPKELKREFGQDIAFHGAIDIQETLPKGSAQDVKDEVYRRVQELGPYYCLTSSHALQTDIPTENVVAMFEATREIRGF